MGDSCAALIEDLREDIEQGRSTQHNQGKTDRDGIKELFQLVEKEHWDVKDQRELNIEKIRGTLIANKTLILSRFKMRSLIHATKYNTKINYECKQHIINTIVDVGYELFHFDPSNSISSDNFHALFFVAAKGDFEKLQGIVIYFKRHDQTKIYDTHEGDTILSFMIKFGDHFQEGFLDCFKLMAKEHIDVDRVDYFNKDISDIIETETDFLMKVGDRIGHIAKLNEIKEIVNQFCQDDQNLNSKISGKYKLFQALIKKDDDFPKLLTQHYVDASDGENTLLQLAIIKADLKVTKELLRKGANPNHVTEFGNKEVPLVLAAKLGRVDIFRDILKNKKVNVTNSVFSIFVREVKPKFLNYLLESDAIDVNVKFKGRIPLFYAINRKNRTAVQSLLRKGSRVNESHLQNINPKDLEDYLNSCIKQDTFADNMEENQYKPLLVFDFFVNLSQLTGYTKDCDDTFESEVTIIRNLGDNKRLKYLLEHPLVYIFIILKWHCVKAYYTFFLLLQFIFYIIIDVLLYSGYFIVYGIVPVLLIQGCIVLYNFREFKWKFRKYTLHYIFEILIFLCLTIVCALSFINLASSVDTNNYIIQISAVIIILTSLSILLTIGYHFSLAKWMAMAKRVFKNFTTLLLFFMIPIVGFATSFRLINSLDEDTKQPKENESSDFDSLPRAVFRTLIMLGGDIGDKKFSAVGGYVVFIFFTIVMAIILLNFWTGVAVSDIKEIEEQSTVVAFKNVVIFIEGVERIYHFFCLKVFPCCLFPGCLKSLIENRYRPFLKSQIYLNENSKRNFNFGLDFYINSQIQFRHPNFRDCKIPNKIILKIKSLFEEKEVNVGKTLKEIIAKLASMDEINIKLNKIQQTLNKQSKSK